MSRHLQSKLHSLRQLLSEPRAALPKRAGAVAAVVTVAASVVVTPVAASAGMESAAGLAPKFPEQAHERPQRRLRTSRSGWRSTSRFRPTGPPRLRAGIWLWL